jgi:parvulin-like peptidyl-prolyl isomerase
MDNLFPNNQPEAKQSEDIKSEAGRPETGGAPSVPVSTAPSEAPKCKAINIKINIKHIIIVVAVVAVLTLIWLVKGFFVAAVVNGVPVSRFTVIRELERVSGKDALDALIIQKLIDTEVGKKGIAVSADEIKSEIKKIEDQLKEQGQDLANVLKMQNMTRADLEKRIAGQKKVEKLLADKTKVEDSEVEQYLKDNKVTIPKGKDAEYKNQIKEQLAQQKLSKEYQTLLDSLRSQAKIYYFVNY